MSATPFPPAVHSALKNDLDCAENMLAHAGLFCNETALFRTRLAVEVSTALSAVRLLVGAHQTVTEDQVRDALRVVETCLRIFTEQRVDNTPLHSALKTACKHLRRVHHRLYAHNPDKALALVQQAAEMFEAWDVATSANLATIHHKVAMEVFFVSLQTLRDQLNA